MKQGKKGSVNKTFHPSAVGLEYATEVALLCLPTQWQYRDTHSPGNSTTQQEPNGSVRKKQRQCRHKCTQMHQLQGKDNYPSFSGFMHVLKRSMETI